jgi:ArsR family transcriptional regulator
VKQIDDASTGRMERMFFGLADETRLMILDLLSDEELCACEITAALNLTQPTTSHHLGILETTGLVTSRREGKWVFYRLIDRGVASLLAKASALAQK